MAARDAITALAAKQNSEIQWLLGAVLIQRAARSDWYDCRILQQLERGTAKGWNELIGRCRGALSNPEELLERCQKLLNPVALDFDDKLEDFIAEMVAVAYLLREGYADIHFLRANGTSSPDIEARLNGFQTGVEVKQLREPSTVTYVAFRRWNRNKASDPDRYAFDVQIDSLDPEFDLTFDQRHGLQEVVDGLPNRARPSEFIHTLADAKRVRFTLRDGEGVMVHHGGVSGTDDILVDVAQGLVLKALEPMRKALTQLYGGEQQSDVSKMLFFRWQVPDQAFMDAIAIRDAVQDGLQNFLGALFPNLQVVIVTSLDRL